MYIIKSKFRGKLKDFDCVRTREEAEELLVLYKELAWNDQWEFWIHEAS